MKNDIIKELDTFISELNNNKFKYSYEVLKRNPITGFDKDLISNYNELPNINEIIYIKPEEHSTINSTNKFILIETYHESFNKLEFGVPSFSYFVDHIEQEQISGYQIDDSSVDYFNNISDAVSFAIFNFEIQNFQQEVSLDIFKKIDNRASVKEIVQDLCLAESFILSFNKNGNELFKTEIDVDNLKLIAYCDKYNKWTEISHFDNNGLSSQVTTFLSDNYPAFIKETTELSAYYAKQENKKNLKTKKTY